MKPLYLSVDLGGTSLRIATVDGEGKILKTKSFPSTEVRAPQDLIKRLIQECQSLAGEIKNGSLQGIALGIPGLVEGAKGVVFQSPHFPLWKEIPLKKELEKILPFPIFMDNDANQAARGEAWRGAGKDWQDFVMLTLGTGIGGGIFASGGIFHGPTGFAGEVGHIIIDRNGFTGALGSQGTLESICSQSGLQLQVKALQKKGAVMSEEILKLNADSEKLPELLLELAQKGNKTAKEIWDDFGKALACGIASLVHTLGSFHFIIGGGLAGAWDQFYPACEREISKRLYTSTLDRVKIVCAQLGNEAGLMGGVPLINEGLVLHK